MSGSADTKRRARGPLHLSSVIIAVVVVAIAATLSVVASRSISAAASRQLAAQTDQVDSALQATIAQIQQPLIAAARIATIGGVEAFESYVRPDVGDGAPFSSASLWQVRGRSVTLLSMVKDPGTRPQLLEHPTRAHTFLRTVPPSTQLTVVGLLAGPVRSLGYAERLPGSKDGYVVYAEAPLPDPPMQTFPATSPFSGLDFALYYGPVVAPPLLMLTSVALPPGGASTTTVVAFASARVTILATIEGPTPGALPAWSPWAIIALGVLLAALAALLTERLVRRREAAESEATVRTAAYTEQRDIASTLQHAMLPSERPVFPGVEMATRYVAGVKHLDVGGDWFDAIPIDEHRLFLTVGDVSGRGLIAATTMSSLRHAIRAYAVQGDEPVDVIRKLGGLVDVGRDGCFATVLCCKVDVLARTASFASAGHTPALLVDAAGPRFLDAPPNTPVGVEGRHAPRGISMSLEEGTVLVAYTDGLVERHGQSLDDGLALLRSAPVDWSSAAADVLSSVVATMVPSGADDDVAVLVVRLLPAGATAASAWRERARRRFANDPGSVALAREFAATSLPDATPGAAEAVTLCVSELASNALLHARSDFEVAVLADEPHRAVRVEVTDSGAGEPALRVPPPTVPRGRGIQLLEGVTSRWGVARDPGAPTKQVWFEIDGALRPVAQAPRGQG